MSNIENITIREARELAALFAGGLNAPTLDAPERSPCLGKHVVVRNYSAGVHIGIVAEKSGTNVVLKDARRLYKWEGAFTLSEVATSGVKKSGSRISVSVPLIELTQAIELIPTSEAARAAFDAIHE